jgi:hypothetical protein
MADLTGAKTPKIDARGYQDRKIKSGRPNETNRLSFGVDTFYRLLPALPAFTDFYRL